MTPESTLMENVIQSDTPQQYAGYSTLLQEQGAFSGPIDKVVSLACIARRRWNSIAVTTMSDPDIEAFLAMTPEQIAEAIQSQERIDWGIISVRRVVEKVTT